MNGLTIQPNGQTLVVTAGPANFYSDTGLSAAVTYPVTVSATTPWYCSAAVAAAVPDVSLTITQPDGSTIYSGSIRVGQTTDTFVRPQPTGYQVAEDIRREPRHSVYTAGNFYGPRHAAPGVVANGVGLIMASPFWVDAAFTADRIIAQITAGNPTAVVRLGIWGNSATDTPGNLLLDAGTIDASAATSTTAATISYGFVPGLYWLSAVPQVAAATLKTVGISVLVPVAATTFIGTADTQGMNSYYQTGITGALPATWGATAIASSSGYLVKVRAA